MENEHYIIKYYIDNQLSINIFLDIKIYKF